jgi:hypothetical protein
MFQQEKKLPKVWTAAVIDVWLSSESRAEKNYFLKACNLVRTLTDKCLLFCTWDLRDRRVHYFSLCCLGCQMETGAKIGFRPLKIEELSLPKKNH